MGKCGRGAGGQVAVFGILKRQAKVYFTIVIESNTASNIMTTIKINI